MGEVFNNYGLYAVASTINGSTTTLPLASASGLKTTGNYRLLIDPNTVNAEIVEVTSVSGNNLTVVRGTEGTSGVSHSAGAVVVPIVTAAALAAIQASLGADVVNTITGPTTATVQLTATNEMVMSGTITANSPSMGEGEWFAVKVLGSMGGNSLVVNPPSGGATIEVPLGVAGTPGTYASSVTFTGAAYNGLAISWYLDSNGNLSIRP
jgi:hypothetical protein